MAINIDTIYQRVLAIANKEQRGYVTPQEFNLLANQAQLEVFEQYFYDNSQFNRVHGNSTEYSDMLDIIDQKLSIFQQNQQANITETNNPAYASTFGASLVTNGTFDSDITSWTAAGGSTGTQAHYSAGGVNAILLKNNDTNSNFSSSQAITTVVGKLYRVKADINAGLLNSSGSNAAAKAFITLAGSPSASVIAGSSSSVVFYYTASATSSSLVLNINAAGNTTDSALFDNIKVEEVTGRKLIIPLQSIYRLGTVMYTDSTGRFVEVNKVMPNELLYINSAPLTKPTESNPIYVLEGNSISIYPANLTSGQIAANYIRKPNKCNWAYNVINEKALFDSNKSINFELHISEEVTLVNKILELAGMTLQKKEIQEFGSGKDNKEVQQEKS